ILTVTCQLHAATTIAGLSSKHPQYALLAGRIVAAFLHKATASKSFSAWVALWATNNPFNTTFINNALMLGPDLDNAIVHSRDFDLTYASIRTMTQSYLLRVNGRVIQRPQYLYMRVALAAHGDNLDLVTQTYDALSHRLFTPASPVLFNAGTLSQHYASCFLHTPEVTSPVEQLASAAALDPLWLADGGIGLSLAGVPAKRTRGPAQPGIQPLLQIYDAHAHFTSVHRQRHPSAATIHLPIWHGDVRAIIHCHTNSAQSNQVRNLYPSLWIPDIFMRRLRDRQMWTLFDPRDVPLLLSTYGDQFSTAYENYKDTVAPIDQIATYDLWIAIARAQQESGTPFLMYQDAINGKNNHSHLGIIRTSNLCTEIVQFTSATHTAVCTLTSIAVPRFAAREQAYDFDALY
ncbi:PFL-like glycyl radical enzyme, partial [Lentinus tigrinus ALCF2SS1-6]